MAKKYYMGEGLVRQLSDLLPYLDRMKRMGQRSKPPKKAPVRNRTFLAKLTSAGPSGEADLTGAMYWAREIIITNSDGDYTSAPTFAYPVRPSGVSLAKWLQSVHWVAATNLDELVQVTPAHDMPTDDSVIILVHAFSDQDRLTRYVFSGPAIVVN